MDELLKRVWFYDFEVFANDWLLVLERYSDEKEVIFHNSDSEELYEFVEKYDPILVGYNNKYYDQYIMKAIMADFSMQDIKKVNDYIIAGNQGFEIDYGYVKSIPNWDLMHDIVPIKGLKEIEGNMGLDITETTIPFDLPTKWNKQEYEEVLHYCRHDVKALRPLFEARMGYFKTKVELCKLVNIDPAKNAGLTNAKVVAKYLGAKMVKRDDEREYDIPDSIDVSYIPQPIIDFFMQIKDKSIDSETLFKMKFTYKIGDVNCDYGWGGMHGAKTNYNYIAKDDGRILVNCDFASLYPHILALPRYNYISRNIIDQKRYSETLKHRLELKKAGKKKEQAPFKLVLNTAYGCMNNQYNDLFDPRGARGTCITGQLLLTTLIFKVLKIKSCGLIQLSLAELKSL